MQTIQCLNDIHPEWFSDTKSFDAFKLAATKAWSLQALLEDDCFMVHTDRYLMTRGVWEVYYDVNDGPIVSFNVKECRTMFVTCKSDDNNLWTLSSTRVCREFDNFKVARYMPPILNVNHSGSSILDVPSICAGTLLEPCNR